MPLPKIETQYFRSKIISKDRIIHVRPFTLKEQKVLIRFNDENENVELYKEIVKLVDSCIKEDDVDITELLPIDFQNIFYDIRSYTDSELITFEYKYKKDDGTDAVVPIEINVKKDLEVERGEDNFDIQINDKIHVTFTQLKMKHMIKIYSSKLPDEEKTLQTIALLISKVKHDDEVLVAGKNFTESEAIEFIQDFPIDKTAKIINFINDSKSSFICKKKFALPGVKEPKVFSKEEISDFLS